MTDETFPCPYCPEVLPSVHSRASHIGYHHPTPVDATEKWCGLCEEMKPVDTFSKDKTTACGLRAECRACNNARQTVRRAKQAPRSRTVPRVNESPLGEWKDRAPCRGLDPSLFHPEVGESPEPAKDVCRACPFMGPCRAEAIANHEVGVWGATTDRERQIIRRKRRWAS